MNHLNFFDTERIDEIAISDPALKIDLKSPALAIFTDFKAYKPPVVESDVKALDLEHWMRVEHVRLKIVVDRHDHFRGVIGLDDLSERQFLKRLTKGVRREDLPVTDFMQPKSHLKAFDFAELEHATVADVVAALKDSGMKYCLVIDREQHEIRGIIISNDIAARLQLPLEMFRGHAFSDIYKTLNE
jgi:CBS domain containing-hemolysin-like protein